MNGYNGYFDEIMDFFELSADYRRKAQILQLTDGGLDAVVTAVDGYGFSGQVHLEFQLGGSEGVGDALDAVFAHHIGDLNGSHIGFLLLKIKP